MSADYLAIARQCGIKFSAEVYPSTQITMRVEQLAAYTERVKADERERAEQRCKAVAFDGCHEWKPETMATCYAALQRCFAAIRQETKE